MIKWNTGQGRAQNERGDPGHFDVDHPSWVKCHEPSLASFAIIQFRPVSAAPEIRAIHPDAKRYQHGAPFVSWHRAQDRAGALVPPLLVARRVAPSDPVTAVRVFVDFGPTHSGPPENGGSATLSVTVRCQVGR